MFKKCSLFKNQTRSSVVGSDREKSLHRFKYVEKYSYSFGFAKKWS